MKATDIDAPLGRLVKVVFETVGDTGVCFPAKGHLIDVETGQAIEGVRSINLNISRGQNSVVTATVEIEVFSVHVDARLSGIKETE